jgi:hypothetical protein
MRKQDNPNTGMRLGWQWRLLRRKTHDRTTVGLKLQAGGHPVLLAVIIFCFTFTNPGTIIWPGLDNSYVWAFNFFFTENIRVGRDVLFTYGPLAFLAWPQPQGDNLLIAQLAYAILHFLFVYSALRLALLSGRTGLSWWLAVGLVVFLCYLLMAYMYLKAVFVVAMLFFLHDKTGRRGLLLLASALAAMGLLLRFADGILSVLMVMSYALWLALERRSLALASVLVVTLIFAVPGLWWSVYGDFAGLADYLRAMAEFVSGNSSAMTLSPPNDWIALSVFVLSFIALPLVVRQREAWLLYAVFFLSISAYLKYAFSREGWSLNYAFVFLLVFYVFFVLTVPGLRWRHAALIVATLAAFGANMTHIGLEGALPYVRSQVMSNFQNRNSLDIWRSLTTNRREHSSALLAESANRLRPMSLSPTTRQLIGGATVDVYPHELTYIPANGMNWKPRPVLQSYIAYTPWLDGKNAEHFRSGDIPEFLLWEAPGGDIVNIAIDGRYVLNDEPRTVLEIFNRYRIHGPDGNVLLMKKASVPFFGPETPVGKARTRWGRWIDVPAAPDCAVQRAKVSIRRKLAGRLKRLAYKEHAFQVEYRFSDGTTAQHRFVADNAAAGIWVNPYIVNIWKPQVRRVTGLRFTHAEDDYPKPRLPIAWTCTALKEDYFASGGPLLSNDFLVRSGP